MSTTPSPLSADLPALRIGHSGQAPLYVGKGDGALPSVA